MMDIFAVFPRYNSREFKGEAGFELHCVHSQTILKIGTWLPLAPLATKAFFENRL
jgi:hypothetical protein